MKEEFTKVDTRKELVTTLDVTREERNIVLAVILDAVIFDVLAVLAISVEVVNDDTRNTLVRMLDAVNVFRRMELANTLEMTSPQIIVEPEKEDAVIVLDDMLDAVSDEMVN